MIGLVLGGVRSGKSAFAENFVQSHPGPYAYVATGRAWDVEMTQRIERHRAARDACWETIEAPVDLVAAFARAGDRPVLVDCLTLWLTNLLLEERDIGAATEGLLQALAERRAPVVLVGSEVGLGIVPENALARRFRDEAGLLHQAIARVADDVALVVAGLPFCLKGRSFAS